MHDVISIIFFYLTIGTAIPLIIVSAVFATKIKPNNTFYYCLTIFSLTLAVGAIVNCLIGGFESGSYLSQSWNSWTNSYDTHYYYYRHACVWVGMGLSIGAIVLSIISMILTLTKYSKSKKESNQSKPLPKEKAPKTVKQSSNLQPVSKTNLSYIDEIRELKKLLDCGAITQFEYDMKKREILGEVLK